MAISASNYSISILGINKSEIHPNETIKMTIQFEQNNPNPPIDTITFSLTPFFPSPETQTIAPDVTVTGNFNGYTSIIELEFTTYSTTSPNSQATNAFYGYTDGGILETATVRIKYLHATDNSTLSGFITSRNTYVPMVVSRNFYLSIDSYCKQVIVGSKNCREDETWQLRINEDWAVTGLFPIGTIHMSTDSRNPSEYFGGQWEPFAQGRVLVCVDTSDEDFNTPEKIGGEKTHELTINEMPNHTHQNYLKGNSVASGSTADRALAWASGQDTFYNTYIGSNIPHNNLQKYTTCYMWLRVG